MTDVPRTIRNRIESGDIPAYRSGSIVRLDPAEVDRAFGRVAK